MYLQKLERFHTLCFTWFGTVDMQSPGRSHHSSRNFPFVNETRTGCTTDGIAILFIVPKSVYFNVFFLKTQVFFFHFHFKTNSTLYSTFCSRDGQTMFLCWHLSWLSSAVPALWLGVSAHVQSWSPSGKTLHSTGMAIVLASAQLLSVTGHWAPLLGAPGGQDGVRGMSFL